MSEPNSELGENNENYTAFKCNNITSQDKFFTSERFHYKEILIKAC